jgi:hypothetical protein
VDRIGPSRERQVNARFLTMASHYLFEPEFCNPASGWGEPWSATGPSDRASGQVEKNVQDARHRLWQPMPQVAQPGGAECLAGAAMPHPLGGDPARGGARQRRRGLAAGGGVPDAGPAGL